MKKNIFEKKSEFKCDRILNIFACEHRDSYCSATLMIYLIGEKKVGGKKSRGKIKSGKNLVTCKNLVTFPRLIFRNLK